MNFGITKKKLLMTFLVSFVVSAVVGILYSVIYPSSCSGVFSNCILSIGLGIFLYMFFLSYSIWSMFDKNISSKGQKITGSIMNLILFYFTSFPFFAFFWDIIDYPDNPKNIISVEVAIIGFLFISGFFVAVIINTIINFIRPANKIASVSIKKTIVRTIVITLIFMTILWFVGVYIGNVNRKHREELFPDLYKSMSIEKSIDSGKFIKEFTFSQNVININGSDIIFKEGWIEKNGDFYTILFTLEKPEPKDIFYQSGINSDVTYASGDIFFNHRANRNSYNDYEAVFFTNINFFPNKTYRLDIKESSEEDAETYGSVNLILN